MTGGCSNDDCTRDKDVDSGNIFGGRTRERLASSNIVRNIWSGHVNIGLIKGSSRATDGIQTRLAPALSTVTQIRNACSQIRPSRTDRNLIYCQSKADVKQIGDRFSKQFQCSVTSSEPKLSSRNLPAVPKKSFVEIRSGSKSTKKERSSDPLQAMKIVAKSLPVKSSVNASTSRNSRRTGSENHYDKSLKAQHRTTTRSNDSSALQRRMNQVEKISHYVGSTRNQKTKVSSQVDGGKIKSTPLASQSKLSSRCVKTSKNEDNKVDGEKIKSTPLASQCKLPSRCVKTSKNEENQVEGEKIKSTPLVSQSKLSLRCEKTSKYEENQEKQLNDNAVIAQDLVHPKDFGSESLFQSDISEDSDDLDDILGISCPLCENDLMYSPPNYEYHDEFEPSNLPEVAVLCCGHAFHSRCLEDIIPPDEQCRDPPCYLCLTNID